jgi:diacylglycerol kinase
MTKLKMHATELSARETEAWASTGTCDSAPFPRPQRAPWRQRLVDVERGLAQGVRGDSTFFVYFFLSSLTLVASVVLGLSLMKWTNVLLSLTLVLSAEMFNQSLKTLCKALGRPADAAVRSALRMGTAAVFVVIGGSLIVIGLTLGQACVQMFREL